jgi:hypothetical protein
VSTEAFSRRVRWPGAKSPRGEDGVGSTGSGEDAGDGYGLYAGGFRRARSPVSGT